MKKIETLTPEQWQSIYKLREEYRAIGLCTEPINKPELEKVIKSFYSRIGQKEPVFVYLSNPLLCSIFGSIVQKLKSTGQLWYQLRDQLQDQLGDQLRDQLWDQLGDQLWGQLGGQLWDQLGDQLGYQLRDQLKGQLWDQLGDQLRDQLWDQLGDQLWDQLRDQLWDQQWDQLDDQLGGQLWDYNYLWSNLESYWISFYKGAESIGVKFDPKSLELLNEWDRLSRHAFHWWPKVDICICSDRPRHLHFNQEKQLHADGRKAIEFPDGWGIYANSGRTIPEKYGAVKIKDWESKWLLEEKNAELKMVLIKNIGYQKLFHELEAKKIDSWREYELYRIENVDVEPVHLLKMVCPSTQHVHIGRVPPSIIFAEEAATARNKGIHPSEFAMET